MSLALNGTVLSGRFQVEERVGIEGRFEIFRAVEVTSRRRVVVRILDLEERSDVSIHPEIEHTAKAIMGLTHPGLLPVIDSGGHRARPYLVTPQIEAPTLERLILNGAFPPIGEALKLLAQISEALEHAHRAGVVHGDLTAANILVPREGRPLLADIGVAHWADLATSRSRPQHVPPPLRSPTADLDALRRLSERLINAPVSRPSMPVMAASPLQSSGNVPLAGAWSVPDINQRVAMPAIPSVPSPPAKALDSTGETEVVPIIAPPLTNTGLMPFVESSAVIPLESSAVIEVVPLPTKPVVLTNVPSDTVLLPQLPGLGASRFGKGMEEENTGTMLTPRYVVIAGRAVNRAQEIALRSYNTVRRKIEGWAARSDLVAKVSRSDLVAKIAGYANEGWRRFASLFEERKRRDEDGLDLDAAGLGGWYGMPRSRRIAIAAGGGASLLLLLIITSGPSTNVAPMTTAESALEVETMAATQVATPASVVSEPEDTPKKSNVDRLRERKKKKK